MALSGSRHDTPRPNLFLVGAPKAGTTSLFHYLGQHPQVFTPRLKEPHWAAADLGIAETRGMADTDDYLAMFTDGGSARMRVDASPSGLLSRVAARRIHELEPAAHVVITLRDPVETVAALHDQFALAGRQTHPDIREALQAADRDFGQPLDGLGHHAFERYFDVVDHAPQLRRFRELFPASQIHVVWFDDLKSDTTGTWRWLLDRLGLSVADVDLAPRNRAMRPRSPRLQRLLARPPVPEAVKRLVPRPLARSVREQLSRSNVRQAARPPLPEDARALLRERTRSMVVDLERETGRDLSEWR